MHFTSKIISAIGFLALAYLLGLLLIRAGKTHDDKTKAEFEQYYHIYPIVLPENLVFANEKVPINDFDIRERYDREILTNVYWQSQTLLMLKRANRFFPTIEKTLRKYSIPTDFKYLAVAESGLQNVGSPAGAIGYWQILDATGKRYGLEINEEVDERYDIEKSTEAACKYFREAYKVFGNWALVAASYNMGIEGVKKQLQSQKVNNYYDLYLNTETSRYVLRAIAIKEIIENPSEFGYTISRKYLYDNIPTISIKVTQSIPDLTDFALKNGTNYKLVKLLNPWLRKSSLTISDNKEYTILVPKEKMSQNQLLNEMELDSMPFDKIFGDSVRQ